MVYAGVVLILCSVAMGQQHAFSPAAVGKFEIGRRTFFDFGPPFNYYELFIVSSSVEGISVQRITLTPPTDECFGPAKLEAASASIEGSIETLLGSVNPCVIPEKERRRELKRCKKCPVFSGAEVLLRFQCGTKTRVIRSNILDRDWFDPSAKTPRRTLWTANLLDRLEQAVGPGVMDKPTFPVSTDKLKSPPDLVLSTSENLLAGKYDALFSGTEKPSDLYRAATDTTTNNFSPTVKLKSSVPLSPDVFVAPEYPALARLARVQGNVSLQIELDEDGTPTNPVVISGHPMLSAAALKALDGWRFPNDQPHQDIRLVVEFDLNCRRGVKSD
jgi:TonB family protein